MPRINVLTGETPPPILDAPAPKKKRGDRSRSIGRRPSKPLLASRDSVIPVHPLLASISELPDSIFCFLTKKPDGDFKTLRAAFKEWAMSHLDYTDWRKAWDGFWRLHGPKFGPQPAPDRSAEKVPTTFDKRLEPLLSRAFPRNLRRVIACRGDILAFETAIKGRGEFARKYQLEGYQPLSIEVLPPSMCPAGVPAVAVAHTFIQNGDLMYDPEIVFAVGQPEAWLAYEITQHPVGAYNCAYRDGSLYPGVVKDINGLVSTWARNLASQGWAKQPAPNIGTTLGNVLAFKAEQPSAVLDILAEIEALALPEKQK
jgi:hypothetical protein